MAATLNIDILKLSSVVEVFNRNSRNAVSSSFVQTVTALQDHDVLVPSINFRSDAL